MCVCVCWGWCVYVVPVCGVCVVCGIWGVRVCECAVRCVVCGVCGVWGGSGMCVCLCVGTGVCMWYVFVVCVVWGVVGGVVSDAWDGVGGRCVECGPVCRSVLGECMGGVHKCPLFLSFRLSLGKKPPPARLQQGAASEYPKASL